MGAVYPAETTMNLFTDPWIPLASPDGKRIVPYVALLAGEVDAAEIDHPEPWLAACASMLLAALTQVVLPCDTADDLAAACARPLPADRVRAAVAPYIAGASLLGDGPRFLQPEGDGGEDDPRATTRLFFDRSATYGQTLRARPVEALCASCAALALYGFLAHAPQGGRGYSPSVRGSSPLTTLVELPSVRASAHANTLPRDRVRGQYPADAAGSPWNVSARATKPGDAIGLAEGLFWAPRHVRLADAAAGFCALCGRVGPRVRATSFGPGAKVAGGFFAHPWTPWRVLKGERRAQVVPARPAWTALPSWVRPSDEEGPAPAVASYVQATGATRVVLRAVGARFDQTKWLGTLAAPYAVTLDPAAVDAAARRAEAVDAARGSLLGALKAATPGRGRGLDEAEARFWQAATDAHAHADDAIFARHVRGAALAIFGDTLAVDVAHPTRGPRVARARAGLLAGLTKAFTGAHALPKETDHAT